MIHADYLFLVCARRPVFTWLTLPQMTDVDCLYTANPRKEPTAQPVPTVSDVALIRQSGAFTLLHL